MEGIKTSLIQNIKLIETELLNDVFDGLSRSRRAKQVQPDTIVCTSAALFQLTMESARYSEVLLLNVPGIVLSLMLSLHRTLKKYLDIWKLDTKSSSYRCCCCRLGWVKMPILNS